MTSPVFECHQLGEVGDELAEGEQEASGRVLLDQRAVQPRANAKRARVDRIGGDDIGTERCEAVASL